MALAVDTYELGPIGTNCYVVRAGEARAKPSSSTRAATQSGSPPSWRALALVRRDPGHPHALRPPGRRRRPRRRHGRAGLRLSGRGRWCSRAQFSPPGLEVRGFEGARQVTGGRDARARRHRVRRPRVPGTLAGAPLLLRGREPLLGRRPLRRRVGRVDLPGGDWDTLLDSIRLLAERYPPETVVYSGHGAATTLGAELARNPFLAELRAASQ